MITIQNLSKTYHPGRPNACQALRGVSLDIPDGQMLAVMGKSGSGKSTLLHILGCIDRFDKGSVSLEGRSIKELNDKQLAKVRNKDLGIVLQDFALIQEYSVIENVMTPLFFTRMSGKKRKQLALEALAKVEMASLAKKPVNQLSGGQRQRVAIARAIVNSPKLLLADEPTGALDSQTASQILDIFEKMNREGITVVIVTHDAGVAARCQKTILLEDGQIRQTAGE